MFACGNGTCGVRAALPERTSFSEPATWVAGVYGRPPGVDVPVLASLPDWTRVAVRVGDLDLAIERGTPIEHRRIRHHRVLGRERRLTHKHQADSVLGTEVLRDARDARFQRPFIGRQPIRLLHRHHQMQRRAIERRRIERRIHGHEGHRPIRVIEPRRHRQHRVNTNILPALGGRKLHRVLGEEAHRVQRIGGGHLTLLDDGTEQREILGARLGHIQRARLVRRRNARPLVRRAAHKEPGARREAKGKCNGSFHFQIPPSYSITTI
ncbi:MAG: hypothetical protein HUU21_39700 [Polyangiaceae bacterium]|nr:hypothetical protein [Polyangiaceae bacterium]